MSEHKIGEQWVEKGYDGKMHMYKAVEVATRGLCSDIVVKDLGVLNDDWCLPSPWGGYPKIIHEVDQDRIESEEDVHYDNLWCVEIHKPVLICTDEYPTKQEAIDAWNRRA